MTTRTALVTGASRGIGRAVALALAEAGADVAVNFRNDQAAAEETAAAVHALGRKALIVQADVADPAAVAAMFKKVAAELAPVEILVNNAGVLRHVPLMMMHAEEWQEVLNINLTGAFNCTSQAIRGMRAGRWGRVVNISSDAGRAGEPFSAHYSAAKAGLLGLTKSAARELAGYGITVNAVAPGFIETDMTAETNPAVREKQTQTVPLKRFGTAGEVANLVAFLASDKASYITGQTISVDGGLVM